MDESFFLISEKDEMENKRMDVAISLHLLLKEIGRPDKRLKNVQQRFKAETGGLLPSEINYIFSFPESEKVLI